MCSLAGNAFYVLLSKCHKDSKNDNATHCAHNEFTPGTGGVGEGGLGRTQAYKIFKEVSTDRCTGHFTCKWFRPSFIV